MTQKKKNKRDIERTTKDIIEAAAIEFAENGYKGSRVDTIAKRANINKAMIYYIFGDKEKLHLAVLKELMSSKTKNVFTEIKNERMTSETFVQMMDTYFDDLTDIKEYSKILLDDVSSGAKSLQKLKTEAPELFSLIDNVSKVMQKSMDEGLLPTIDPHKSVISIAMLMVSFICVQPYMDLIVPKDSKEYQDLSDTLKWKEFFMDALSKIFAVQS